MSFFVQDEALDVLLEVIQFSLVRCIQRSDLPDDMKFIFENMKNEIDRLKCRVETKPF